MWVLILLTLVALLIWSQLISTKYSSKVTFNDNLDVKYFYKDEPIMST